MFILCKPTPMAPEDTMTTLCPSRRNLMAVSTIKDNIDRIGSCVISSTIEDVPITTVSLAPLFMLGIGMVGTDFNDYRQMLAWSHCEFALLFKNDFSGGN